MTALSLRFFFINMTDIIISFHKLYIINQYVLVFDIMNYCTYTGHMAHPSWADVVPCAGHEDLGPREP